jgi:nicotinamide-nucleotide amidase
MMDQVMELIGKHKQITQAFHRRLKVASQAESVVDSAIGPIYTSYPQIETTILSSPGIIELFFYWVGEADQELAESQLEELQSRLVDKLGESLFTDQEEGLEEVVGGILRKSGRSVATAESCTGGLLGKMLTDVPGSSDYYRGGVVCYSNNLKVDLVGVDQDSLECFGAVSEPVARQMACGIRESTGADFGLSVTGIAGPDGGTPEKPVGLVFIGLSDDQDTQVRQERFPGTREAIRMRASRYALDWLRRKILTS